MEAYMELKKTTILSAFVAVSGVLAEIIFRDIFSKSFVGVALSIALAAVVLVAFYFTVDGVCCLGSLQREKSSKRQSEYEQRVYNVLNEQLKFQKVVYSEVKNLQQQVSEQQEKMSELSGKSRDASEELAILQKIQDTPNLTKEDLEQFVSEINDNARRLADELGSRTEKLASGLDGQTERLVSEMGAGFERIAAETSDRTERLAAEMKEGQESHMPSEMSGQTGQLSLKMREQLLEEMREETERLLSDVSGQIERLSAEMKEQSDQTVTKINEHTMQAAKVVVKFVGRNTEELKEEIRSH